MHEQKALVPHQFDRAAKTYDLLTTMNPGYRRHLRMSAARLSLGPNSRILDLCCGTGLSTDALSTIYPTAFIVGLDASKGMLEEARGKTWSDRVSFVFGNAMDPAAAGAEGPFDGILMAYGLRNVPDPDTCLSRLFGLLRPGGVLCLHEYSVAHSFRSRAVWNAVTMGIVIPGGLFAAGSTKIYRYLRKSVLQFDGVRELENRLSGLGFREVETRPTDGWQRGIVHSFLARKPL